jgi:hypothetical protein
LSGYKIKARNAAETPRFFMPEALASIRGDGIKDLELPMLLLGIKVNTSLADHVPIDQMQFMRFEKPRRKKS